MKGRIVRCLLCGLLAVFLAFPAYADQVSCPEGGFSLNLPSGFSALSLSSSDPTLCAGWSDGALTVTVYRDYLGQVTVSDLFMVLTGNETYSGISSVAGKEMLCVAGEDPGTSWIYYTWMSDGWNVTVWFSWSADNPSGNSTAQSIMSSVSFR